MFGKRHSGYVNNIVHVTREDCTTMMCKKSLKNKVLVFEGELSKLRSIKKKMVIFKSRGIIQRVILDTQK